MRRWASGFSSCCHSTVGWYPLSRTSKLTPPPPPFPGLIGPSRPGPTVYCCSVRTAPEATPLPATPVVGQRKKSILLRYGELHFSCGALKNLSSRSNEKKCYRILLAYGTVNSMVFFLWIFFKPSHYFNQTRNYRQKVDNTKNMADPGKQTKAFLPCFLFIFVTTQRTYCREE